MLSLAFNNLIEYDFNSHVDLLHGTNDNKCFVTLFKKGVKGNFHRHFKTLDELKSKINDFFIHNNNIDLYMSMNTFFKPERTLESLRYLNTLHMDLDTYKTKFTKTQILMHLEAEYFNKSIPRPNIIMDSGRGLNFVWNIEPVPSKALPLWKALMHKIYNELKEFGADSGALDPTRVLRIPGSINSKTSTEVRVIDSYDYIYSLKELKYEYLPEVIKKEKKKEKAHRKIIKFFTPYSLELARIEDLEKLCEIRNYDLDGCREYILFYYRYLLCRNFDDEYALEKTLELNRKFAEPLTNSEVIHNTKSGERYASKNKYKYSNNRLIELFFISEEEQKQLKTIRSKKIKYEINNEKRKANRRNSNGLTSRQQKKINTLKSVYKLINENLTNKEIAVELNISVRQVQRYKKEIESLDESLLREIKLSITEKSPEKIINNEGDFNKENIEYTEGLELSLKNEIEQSLFVIHKNISSGDPLKRLFKGS